MNFFSARKLIGEETKEELKCIRCGDRPNIVQVMLDPRRGKTLRMYECRWGDLRARPSTHCMARTYQNSMPLSKPVDFVALCSEIDNRVTGAGAEVR